MNAGASERSRPRSVALGPVACDALPWRYRGELRLTVIVKATFDLVPGGPMTLASPLEVAAAEVHYRNLPSRSVRLTVDLVPYLPATDVVLTGDAHAPAGTKVPALTARLRVIRDRPLLERVIHVYGDRADGEGAPTPFDRVPLVYERAFGGAGFRDNPLGIGANPKQAPPNLVDPSDPRKVACFAPVSTTWPARRLRLDASQRAALGQAIPDLSDPFPFEYFHAAPEEQRVVGYLAGDEWIVLDGMHPTHASVHSRLPGVAGAARVFDTSPAGADSAPRDVPLVADTLRIDAERMTCSVVWRGHVPIADDGALANLAVVGALAQPGETIAWPKTIAPEVRGDAARTPAKAPSAPLDGTVAIIADERPPALRTLPFVDGGSAPPAPRAKPSSPPPFDRGSTVSITPEDDPVDVRGGLPFVPLTGAAPPRASRPPPGSMPPPPAVAVEAKASLLPAPAPREASEEDAPRAPTSPAARTPAGRAFGIDLHPDGPLAIAVVPWGAELGRDAITVVAKAVCDLAPDGPCVPRAAPEAPSRERIDGAPPRCTYPSDEVPYKVRADVVLVGHAVAADGLTTAMEVAFHFGHDDNGFARTLRVSGDRRWEPTKAGARATEPEPFVRVPIAYHRAYGGPGFAANPEGMGHRSPMQRGPVMLPNVEDPAHLLRSPAQRPAPATFAPAPLARHDRLAAQRETGLALGDGLDWTRYQAAPRAQQLAFLRGDEPFALAGFSSHHPAMNGALPGLAARCFAARKGAGGLVEVALRLDTVVFDTDAMKVSLVWRGVLPVDDERAPDVQALYLLAEKVGAGTPLADAHRKVLRPEGGRR